MFVDLRKTFGILDSLAITAVVRQDSPPVDVTLKREQTMLDTAADH